MEFGLLDEGLGFKATGTDGAALLQVCVIHGFPLKLVHSLLMKMLLPIKLLLASIPEFRF